MPWNLALTCAGCTVELKDESGDGRFCADTGVAKDRLTDVAKSLRWELYRGDWHCPNCLRVTRARLGPDALVTPLVPPPRPR